MMPPSCLIFPNHVAFFRRKDPHFYLPSISYNNPIINIDEIIRNGAVSPEIQHPGGNNHE